MNRQEAQRKRERAIRQLRECGMTDAEIAAELGVQSLEPETVEPEIIDAQIVSEENLSTDDPIDEKPRKIGALVRLPVYRDLDGDGERERDWSNSPVPERRCKAHKKDGSQCKNAAILGGTVCRFHGGASKFVKQAARARLDNAADRMAKKLLGLAEGAESETVQLQATNSALDRAGLKAPSEVVLSQGSAFDDVFDEISGGSRAESRRARGYPDEPDSFDSFGAESISGNESSGNTLGSERPHHPAPASVYEGDSDRPSSHESYPDSWPDASLRPQRTNRSAAKSEPAHVTGEDALRLANQSNAAAGAFADERGLPPGRSSR